MDRCLIFLYRGQADYTSTTRHNSKIDKTHGTKVSQNVPKVELNTGGCNDGRHCPSTILNVQSDGLWKKWRDAEAHLLFIFIKVKRSSWGDTVWEICRQVSIRSNVDCQFRSSVVAVEVTILVHIGFEIENLTRNYFLPSTTW